jgi:hypothetical protein
MKNKYSDSQLTLMFPKGTRVKVEIPNKPIQFGKVTSDWVAFQRIGVEYDDRSWGYPHTDFVSVA